MKYTPKEPDTSVNVSRQPLKELLRLCGGVVIVAVLVYLLLGAAGWLVVRYSSKQFERKLGKLLVPLVVKKKPKGNPRVQALVDKLLEQTGGWDPQITVKVINKKELGAYTFPGGVILVTQGLLKGLKSENGLAMVLAHELGHVKERDSMKSLGRGLGLLFFAMLIGAENSQGAQMVLKGVTLGHLKYSRDQEHKADLFALDLLNKSYGHAGGALEFFECALSHYGDALSKLTTTHPLLSERIKYLKERIREDKLDIKDTLRFVF